MPALPVSTAPIWPPQRRFTISKPHLALAYLRVSSAGQADKDGFPRQRAVIAAFAAKRGMRVLDEFCEDVSGATRLDERPALSALFTKVLCNGVRTVLVERADRLGRDLIASELILEEFRKLGVTVIEAEAGNDLTLADDSNPTATLIRQVLAAVSQFDRSSIVAKLRAARERKRRETGRCEGVKPFGELPGEAEALARILQLARKPRGRPKRTLAEIAAILNSEDVPSRGGGAWARSTVQGILRRHRPRG